VFGGAPDCFRLGGVAEGIFCTGLYPSNQSICTGLLRDMVFLAYDSVEVSLFEAGEFSACGG